MITVGTALLVFLVAGFMSLVSYRLGFAAGYARMGKTVRLSFELFPEIPKLLADKDEVATRIAKRSELELRKIINSHNVEVQK